MSNESDYHEWRESVRFQVSTEVTLSVGGREFKGITGNISLGGVYLQDIDPEIPETLMGQTGIIKLDISKTPLTLKCKIVYANSSNIVFPAGTGIEFSSPDEASLSIIQNYTVSQS